MSRILLGRVTAVVVGDEKGWPLLRTHFDRGDLRKWIVSRDGDR
jgi:hypothetical protein